MILYTIVPHEHIWKEDGESARATMEVTVGAAILEVEPLNARQVKIVRCISPNIYDYLNPQFTPGAILEWGHLTGIRS